ncbi:Hypothetical predicted protein [Octopus vulgaris]|uniref:Uncharacterized protein n=1 Tax=Octopus vulgaris TaxID=6645 RepID=A0AA36BQA8_OCTVU|nr:Hypothetical predicted protein [Octopus vulgaris]
MLTKLLSHVGNNAAFHMLTKLLSHVVSLKLTSSTPDFNSDLLRHIVTFSSLISIYHHFSSFKGKKISHRTDITLCL